MRHTHVLLSIGICCAHAWGLVTPAAGADAAPAREVLSIYNSGHPAATGWMDAWGDIPAGASARVDANRLVVTGTLENQSYGCVHQPVDIDLDKTPFLEIDVESVSHHWYLLLKGDRLPNGWVKIQPDVDQTGAFQYDLRLALGLTGKQHFDEMQLGVSTEGGAGGNKGQTLVINRLEAVSAAETGDLLQLFGPQTRRLTGWKNLNDDRSPAGVDIDVSPDSVTIRGNRSTHSFGMMFRPVRLDFDTYTVLKIDVASVTHHWFLIMTNPEINKGYVRIQPDCNLAGTFYYDVQDISGLRGVKDVRLQLGVCTNEQSPSVLNETLTFRELSLIAPALVPEGVKALKKKDLKFQQQVQAAVPKVARRVGMPSPIRLVSIEDTPGAQATSSAPAEIQTPNAVDLMRALGEENAGRFAGILNAGATGQAPHEPSFREEGDNLVVANGSYRIAFSRDNGAIKGIWTANGTAPFILGSQDTALWKIDTLDRAVLAGGRHSSGSSESKFTWKWNASSRELKLIYESSPKSHYVEVSARFDASDAIDLVAAIRNTSDKIFQSVSFPNGLGFSSDGLDRVILPRLVGVAFKSGFFRARRQWSDPYPPAFADFAWIGSRAGSLTVYMVQPEGTFQPATLDLGSSDDGAAGYFTHRLPVRIAPGGEWTSPRIRLVAGRHAYSTIRDYARDNGIDRMPDLAAKLPAGTAARLNRSVFIKVDQSANVDIASVNRFLDDLPASSIFHLSAFWPGGFDRNYPDYLPPDTGYGTMDEFKALVARARGRGMFAMPYTNPTWWNDGPTLSRLGAGRIGARLPDGALLTEEYNGNPGVVVSPRHPDVVARNTSTLREFIDTVPMDFLFHDQIGARRWIDAATESGPGGYTAGLLEEVRRESPGMPLMTEGGFDRLLADEIGFCGMTSMSYPGFKEYDDLWGKSSWEIDPVSLFLAHAKVNFYQHNLSNDVVADNNAKIAWNVAHGFGLNAIRTYIRQNLEKRWIAVTAALHEHVLSRMLGREMSGYLKLDGNIIWSRFGDMDVYARIGSDALLTIGPYTIARDGFMAVSKEGDLIAGLFNRFNGEPLDGEHYLIVTRQDTQIAVIQPDPTATFVTVARPAAWKSDARIRAYRVLSGVESEVAVAIGAGAVTFFCEAEHYRIRYEPDMDKVEFAMRVSPDGPTGLAQVGVDLVIRNGGAGDLSVESLTLSAWDVGPADRMPGFDFPTGGWSRQVPAVSSGQQAVRHYRLEIPASSFVDAGRLWFRACAVYSSGDRRFTKSIDGTSVLGH